MAPPGNGIFVVRGEMATLMTAMKRGHRWSSASYQEEEQDGLMKQFIDLKAQLAQIEDLRLVEPIVFLTPFLDVIRSEETTGPITSLALSTVNKFLAYGLIDATHPALAATVEAIADAVTHARFVGTDQAADGVVLMKIVQVLRTLMLNPEGSVLTNECVCEVMLSCFRICFEGRLSELLCQTAELALRDIVLLLFMRLPQFAEERSVGGLVRRLKMMAGGGGAETKKKKSKVTTVAATATAAVKPAAKSAVRKTSSASSAGSSGSGAAAAAAAVDVTSAAVAAGATTTLLAVPHAPILSTTPATPLGNIVDMQGKMLQTTPLSSTSTAAVAVASAAAAAAAEESAANDAGDTTDTTPLVVQAAAVAAADVGNDADAEDDDVDSIKETDIAASTVDAARREDFVNSMGVRFTPVSESESSSVLEPYGLPCVRELLRFLVSLCNPLDKQNTDRMTHIGLSLLTVALEVGADHIGNYESLMVLVKDDMCRNLFALLNQERLSIFAADLQVCFLLFESLRADLKFHLEFYLARLFDIVGSDNVRVTYEKRELALDNILQFCRIPGFAAELYINFDCNLYCSDLLEQLVQLLSKNTLSAGGGQQPLYSVHQMSLDGLLTIVKGIERNCAHSKTASALPPAAAAAASRAAHGGRHSRNSSSLAGIVLDTSPLATTSSNDLAAANSENEGSGVENVSSFSSVDAALAAGKRQNAALTSATAAVPESPQQLQQIKQQKRILTQGTELFNQRPDKGIQFLQENGMLQATLNPSEVARFLRDNAGLDKAMIGEYISKKKNVELRILENFVESFDFRCTRIDLALRQYLETFRLPGEAPLIFLVMEHFADHWHKCNDEPFAHTDSAFRLAYAIIMLNMDQHNYNAKRLNIPMTAEDFMKNLRGLNGNADFDQTMLAEIYNGIKTDEIIMPAEQTGLIRENYLWRVLLRRGVTKDARFTHVADAQHDQQLFQLLWGPTLAAISYIFDKTAAPDTAGLASGARIAAHYGRHADFDGLLLTLCKFTGLLSAASTAAASDPNHQPVQPPNANADIALAVQLAQNARAQLALQTVFALLHEHADCAREGWRPVLDVCVQLFRAKLLPRSLTEVEDFCEPSGRVQLATEKPAAKPADAGIFSSLYSYLASDGLGRQPTYEEQEHIRLARRAVRECHIDRVISDSKFVQFEALQELLGAFGAALRPPAAHKSLGLPYAEEVVVFQMELMVKVLVQNRDRVLPAWQPCRDRMYQLLAGAASCGYPYLLGRTTVAVLKLAIYLMRNEELCSAVLQSLRMLLALKPAVIYATSRPIALGIYELLKTSAQNIHTEADWEIVFQLLECVGAGAIPPEADEGMVVSTASLAGATVRCTRSDGAASSEDETGGGPTRTAAVTATAAATAVSSDRGYTSDSDLSGRLAPAAGSGAPTTQAAGQTENWILVNSAHSGSGSSSDGSAGAMALVSCPASPAAASLQYPCRLLRHSPFALVKCWESLAFIVRNVAHITPYNFESCVKCIRTFVEASLSVAGGNAGGGGASGKGGQSAAAAAGARSAAARRSAQRRETMRQHGSGGGDGETSDDTGSNGGEDDDDLLQRYELIAEQLLDLMHTLHTRTAQIYRWWAEEGGSAAAAVAQPTGLWAHGWCPLLQGIARLVNDRRREVRTHAIEYLQRALLVHDLQALTGPEWQSCFRQVIFPLLLDLLAETAREVDAALLDESRIRTATIMWKVFLHHLSPLIGLPAFGELWLEILDFMERFMGVGSDMLHEAMREGLKNMLLVVNMHPVRVFHSNAALWNATWERIGQFMPQLKDELFKDKSNHTNAVVTAATAAATAAAETSPVPPTASAESAPQHAQPLEPTSPASRNAAAPVDQPNQQQPQIVSLLLPETSADLQAPACVPVEQSMYAHPAVPTLVAPVEQPQQQPQQQHIPYLVSQAQQQFALMEQQYAQQYHQQQPQPPPPPQTNAYAYTLDMGDSEPEMPSPHSQSAGSSSAADIEPAHATPAGEQVALASAAATVVDATSSHLSSQSDVLAGLVHSFAPVSGQPLQQQQQHPYPQLEAGDIYNDYALDPYNLIALNQQQQQQQQPPQQPPGSPANQSPFHGQQAPANANVFQSANYFGSSEATAADLFGSP